MTSLSNAAPVRESCEAMKEPESQDRDDRLPEARESGAAEAWPVIARRFEPVPDLEQRLRRIYALLSLPPYPLDE